jgi:hypothetical protein
MTSTLVLRESDLPAFFLAADKASKSAQKALLRWTAAILLSSVAAAAFGIIQLRDGKHFDFAGLITLLCLGLGALGAIRLTITNPRRTWYDTRAAAESVKSLAWQYAVGGGDFAKTVPEMDARRELLETIADVRTRLDKQPLPLPGVNEVTQAMQALRAAPLDVRRRTYEQCRIKDQEDFYVSKAAHNEKARKWWGVASICAQIAGAVIALLKMLAIVEIDLVGVAATLAVAVAAWLRTKAFDELAEAYAVTAHDVKDIRARVDDAHDDEEWATFVANAEQGFSREHTIWLARTRDR